MMLHCHENVLSIKHYSYIYEYDSSTKYYYARTDKNFTNNIFNLKLPYIYTSILLSHKLHGLVNTLDNTFPIEITLNN